MGRQAASCFGVFALVAVVVGAVSGFRNRFAGSLEGPPRVSAWAAQSAPAAAARPSCAGEKLIPPSSGGRHAPISTVYRTDGADSPLTIRTLWASVPT